MIQTGNDKQIFRQLDTNYGHKLTKNVIVPNFIGLTATWIWGQISLIAKINDLFPANFTCFCPLSTRCFYRLDQWLSTTSILLSKAG